jgi:hypothetical protein
MARHIIEAHYELQAECSACGSAELAHECRIRPKDIVGKRVTVKMCCCCWFVWLVVVCCCCCCCIVLFGLVVVYCIVLNLIFLDVVL